MLPSPLPREGGYSRARKLAHESNKQEAYKTNARTTARHSQEVAGFVRVLGESLS